MATLFRVNKAKNYTTISNYHLQDKTLSFKAKGLLSFMLSLPDEWDYYENNLYNKKDLYDITQDTNEEILIDTYFHRNIHNKDRDLSL